MNQRCTFYRIARDQAKQLFAARTVEALKAFFAELDQATPRLEGDEPALILHRVLTDGSLEPSAGDYPLNHAVLGGRVLGQEAGFGVVLKRPDMCPHIAEALSHVQPESIESLLSQLRESHSSSSIAALLAQLADFYRSAAASAEAVVLVQQTP